VAAEDQPIPRDPTDDPTEAFVPPPAIGRVYVGHRRVRLGDASPGGRLRFDALVRYVQDVANDDTRDAGFDDVMGWVVRRTVIEIEQFPVYLEPLTLSTWCGGVGSRWAERRVQVTGEGGGRVETATLWVHLDSVTMRPKVLPESFHTLFSPSAGGRTVRARLHHDDQPAEITTRHPFPLRFTDFDVLGHVNNAVYWETVEEELARRRELRAPLRAELEHRAPIEPGADLEVVADEREYRSALWLRQRNDGEVYATAVVTALKAAGSTSRASTGSAGPKQAVRGVRP
jgi:acyl-ACP thioesterase